MPLTTDELKTLDRLLQQVLDLPMPARAIWIDALPPAHSALAPFLRANLLRVDSPDSVETADFLGALPTLPADAFEHDEPTAGEQIGPYQLIRSLGEGGMSSVWLAERVNGTLRREVALKLPHRHLLDRGLAARMLRERDILASLSHDHIARLYDAGVDGQGRPYLALEYVEGSPINNFCADSALSLHGRIGLMVQVMRAVAYAHANLVVHRDLKPNNILITQRDAAPVVKLLDFGIAKLLASAEQQLPTQDLTQTLGRALTPDYASPEQLLEQPVTTASDIYSLGVVLYQVVTGEKPYKLSRQSASALAEAVIKADVIRPSKRSAQGKYPQDARRIAGDLDAIILKALKLAPTDRYATASAFADDLERFLGRQPVLAQPDSVAYRLRRFVQRHALAVGASTAVCIALVAGVAIALWQMQQARLETAKTKAVKDFLQSILTVGNVDQQDALMRRKEPIGDVLLDAAKSMPGRFADQPEIRSEIQGLLGGALEGLALRDSARSMHEARFAELNSRDAPLAERMRAQVDLAMSLGDTADAKRGTKLLEDAIVVLANARDVQSRIVLAEASQELAMVKIERFDGTSGVADAMRAANIARVIAPQSKLHASSLAALGLAYTSIQDIAQGEVAFKNAIEVATGLPPSERAFEALVRQRYADALITARFHQRALGQLTEALKVVELTSGSETFRWARTAVVAAHLTAASGDPLRAIDMFKQVLKVYDKFGKELDPLFASTANVLYANTLVEYGQFADAERIARAAYEAYRGGGQQAVIQRWFTATRYANVLQEMGDYAGAEKLLVEAATAARDGGLSRKTSSVTSGERLLALNHIYCGRHAEAQSILKGIIEIDGAPKGRFVNQRNLARLTLARAYLAQGNLDDAETEIAAMARIIGAVAEDEIAFSRTAAAELESLAGTLDLQRGNAAAAALRYRRSIALMEPAKHANSPHLANARADLALALAMVKVKTMATKGDRTEAKTLAVQARAAFAPHPAIGSHLTKSLIEAEKLLRS